MNRVGIFWDYENCCSSSGASGYSIVGKIREAVLPFGAVSVFNAYLDVSLRSPNSAQYYELQSSGVSIIHTPHNGRKEAADRIMSVDLLVFGLEGQGHATVILITGDRDFSYAVSALRLRGHVVIFISPPKATHHGLKYLADGNLDWKSDIVECESPGDKTHALVSQSPRTERTLSPSCSCTRPSLPSWVHESPSLSEASAHTCVEDLELSHAAGMAREGDSMSPHGKHTPTRMGPSKGNEADQRRNVASQATQTCTDGQVFLRPSAPSSDQVSRGVQTLVVGNTLAEPTQDCRSNSEDGPRDDEKDVAVTGDQDTETVNPELRESVDTLPAEKNNAGDAMTAVCDSPGTATYINPYLHKLCIINIPHNVTYETLPSPSHKIRHSDIRSFTDLIEVLEQEQTRGNLSTPYMSLDNLLLQTNPETYRQAGAAGLKGYLELARNANVVSFFDVNWQTEEGRIFFNTGQIGRFRDMGLLEQEPESEPAELTPVMELATRKLSAQLQSNPTKPGLFTELLVPQKSTTTVPLELAKPAPIAETVIPNNHATGFREETGSATPVTKPVNGQKPATDLGKETANPAPVTETNIPQKAVTQLQSGSTKPALVMVAPVPQKPVSQEPTKPAPITVTPQTSAFQPQAESAKPSSAIAQVITSQKSPTQIGKEPVKSDFITGTTIPQKDPTQLQPEPTKPTAVVELVTPQRPVTQVATQSTKPIPDVKPVIRQAPVAQSVTEPAKPIPTTKPVAPQKPATQLQPGPTVQTAIAELVTPQKPTTQVETQSTKPIPDIKPVILQAPASQSVTRPIKPIPTTKPVAPQKPATQPQSEPKKPVPVVKPSTPQAPQTTSVQASKAAASTSCSTTQKTTSPPVASGSHVQSSSSSTPKATSTIQRKAVEPSLVNLVDVMRELRSSGTSTVVRSIFCDTLRKRFPKKYLHEKPGTDVKQALASNVVILSKGGWENLTDYISLHPDYF